jgi:hypothetical protein
MKNLLREIKASGATFFVKDGALKLKAPPGTVTPEMLGKLKEHREGLLGFLLEQKKRLPSPTALAWLLEHREALDDTGWTAPELYRRNKSRGIAWMPIWNRPGLLVDLAHGGVIQFDFQGTRGTTRQTARPRKIFTDGVHQ